MGQQQQAKPSRTDNCHCPEVSQLDSFFSFLWNWTRIEFKFYFVSR